jgi:hypothetical protein
MWEHKGRIHTMKTHVVSKLLFVFLLCVIAWSISGCEVLQGLLMVTPTASPSQLSCTGFALTTPSALLPLPDGEITFTWSPVQNATAYRLAIVDGADEVLAFEVDGTVTSQPVDLSSTTVAEADFTARVEAFGDNGSGMCVSETFFSRDVAPPSGPGAPGG